MTQNWIDVTARETVAEDDVVGIDVNGKDLALYSVSGEVFATDNICTHGHARLSDGFLDGCEIECPLHQGKFDIRNGKALCEPVNEDIRSYPVKIQDGRVFVDLGSFPTS
ncbi:naphthalene 1,2-dioxygenase system ferredoxin subunit [Collimonas sp. OK607]|uniref:non-heme iron oxygenase ferredoxin subunit n=1 Tax=Collimonas sp. OK607 TaxID=1798194 RepID=UPI0008E0F2E5|nr:non-heme iron oxygenase ferredoxin subunit [Collimonas sp. OK607]SFB38278.1 naphthalene 1,2-dioxygenase system ferredoxin subunit [Collimonas sp. OK607]